MSRRTFSCKSRVLKHTTRNECGTLCDIRPRSSPSLLANKENKDTEKYFKIEAV